MRVADLIRATPRTPESERAAWTGRAPLASLNGHELARVIRRRRASRK